jgi:hypothetical protein
MLRARLSTSSAVGSSILQNATTSLCRRSSGLPNLHSLGSHGGLKPGVRPSAAAAGADASAGVVLSPAAAAAAFTAAGLSEGSSGINSSSTSTSCKQPVQKDHNKIFASTECNITAAATSSL